MNATTSPTANSLVELERFFGEELSQEHVDALASAPEDQLIDLFSRLADCWTNWFDERFDKGRPPDGHYFVGERFSSVAPLPAHVFKQLALYFPSIATPDPVEACVGAHVELAKFLGTVPPTKLRADMKTGVKALLEVAPLVRAGAVQLVPSMQAGLTTGVQEVARKEVGAEEARGNTVSKADEDFAVATGLCSMAAFWPVVSSEFFWEKLRKGGLNLEQELARCNMPIARAVAEFEVPNVSQVAVGDVLRLRGNEQCFADFRSAFGVAVLEALDQSVRHGSEAGHLCLVERLKVHQDRCNAAAKGTSAFDGVMLPAASVLAAGGVAYYLDPVGGAQLLQRAKDLLIGVAAPGASWIVMDLLQRIGRGVDPSRAIYSALLDK